MQTRNLVSPEGAWGRARGSAAVALLLALPAIVHCTKPPPAPFHLSETGLYSDAASHTVDPRNLHFAPQYPLWSDGARKSRWVYLPPGKAIDASNPDIWDFPVGTKFWKEFVFGRRVETRYLEKVSKDQWNIATYVWNETETDAVRAPDDGIHNHVEIVPGKRHDIPGISECKQCHEGQRIQVLGFSALQLSPDRDPGAPHAEPFTPGMVDLAALIERKLIAFEPKEWVARPPRIAAASSTERAALGYLHSNCGSCHDRSTSLASIGMVLRQSAAAGGAPDSVVSTAIHQRSQLKIPGDPTSEAYRIEAGDPSRSAVVFRMATRNPTRQMPPLGTKVVDEEGVALVRRWIADLRSETRQPVHDKERP